MTNDAGKNPIGNAQGDLFADLASGVTQDVQRAIPTVPEAIAAGYHVPDADNPFLFSSALWEAFHLGQYLNRRGLSPDNFRKVRHKYGNADGLFVKYYYDRYTYSWFIDSNR